MISAYYSFPMPTPENELVDERWESDFKSSKYNITDHINDKKSHMLSNTMKEINLPHPNNKNSIIPDKDADDAYFEITSAPPDYPSTPSEDEDDDSLPTPPLNEALPLEQYSTPSYESLEEEVPDQYFISESMYDYHSELSDYYKQLVLNKIDQLSNKRLESIQSTLPEMYKKQIENLRKL